MAPGVVVELVALGEDPSDEGGVLGQPATDGEQADRRAGLAAVSSSWLTRIGSPDR
jgi:hypothetical protein